MNKDTLIQERGVNFFFWGGTSYVFSVLNSSVTVNIKLLISQTRHTHKENSFSFINSLETVTILQMCFSQVHLAPIQQTSVRAECSDNHFLRKCRSSGLIL